MKHEGRPAGDALERRNLQEITEQLDLAELGVAEGSRWPALSYEEGVVATIHWALHFTDEPPMHDGADEHEEATSLHAGR